MQLGQRKAKIWNTGIRSGNAFLNGYKFRTDDWSDHIQTYLDERSQ